MPQLTMFAFIVRRKVTRTTFHNLTAGGWLCCASPSRLSLSFLRNIAAAPSVLAYVHEDQVRSPASSSPRPGRSFRSSASSSPSWRHRVVDIKDDEAKVVPRSLKQTNRVRLKAKQALDQKLNRAIGKVLPQTAQVEFTSEKEKSGSPKELHDTSISGKSPQEAVSESKIPASSVLYDPSSLSLALKRTQKSASDTVVIFLEKRAFWIVPPKNYASGARVMVDNFIRNGLSGVMERVLYKEVKSLTLKTSYRTYDVESVDEILMHIEKQKLSGNIKIDLRIDHQANDAWENRFREKERRRSAIAAVEELRHPDAPLLPHQLEGVRFFIENNGCGLLGDEMGLGKTATALAYVASQGKRALVVTPKKVVPHWCNSANMHFPAYFMEEHVCRLSVEIKATDEKDWSERLLQARLVCINYEALGRFFHMILEANLDTIIIDESHYIKNPKSIRARLLLQLRDLFPHRMLLSGTPIKNNVEEFIPQLKFLGVEDNVTAGMKDMEPGSFWNFLQERTLYMRREILRELPHLQFNEVEMIEVEGEIEVTIVYDKKGNILETVSMEQNLVATSRHKIPSTAAFAADLMKKFCKDKIIIMTERIMSAKLIFEHLGSDAIIHHGELSEELRKAALESFVSAKDSYGPRALIATRQSIGVGINLQCANHVIFNDLAWTPADILQAAARAKRLDQEKIVHEYWMLAKSDFDNKLVKILKKKLSLMRLVAEGKNVSDDDKKWMKQGVSFKELFSGVWL